MTMKKMTTDQMITMAQNALAQDVETLTAESEACLKVFTDTELKLNAANEKLQDRVAKLDAMEQAINARKKHAMKLIESNEAVAKKIHSIVEGCAE